MTDEKPARQTEHEDAASRQRQRALADLAQSRQSGAESAPAAPSAHGSDWTSRSVSRSPRRAWRLALAAAVLVAVVLGIVGYAVWPRPAHPTTQHTPPPSLITLSQSGLDCYQDVVWSPDSTLIAVLGYKLNCPSSDPRGYEYTPGQLDIYAAATGTIAAQLTPDDPITQALHLAPPKDVTPSRSVADVSHQVITYRQVLWSPDGKQLALSFQIEHRTADDSPGSSTDGVLLTDLAGTQSRTLAHTFGPSEVASGEWNLTTGDYIPLPATADPATWHPAPPAMTFAWGADGALIRQDPPLSLTSVPPAPALSPIGNPIGGATFSVWQPASVSPITDPADVSAPILAYFYSVRVPAWSPDGSHLILDTGVSDLLVADPHQPPDAGYLASHRIQGIQGLLPMRDKGLLAALTDARHMPANGDTTSIQVLWRPDGRVVAVPLPPSVSASQPLGTPPAVRLYDCTTGRLLSTLREPIEPAGAGAQNITVRWSPDGTHLLLFDPGFHSLTIWGSKQLPRV